MLLEKDDHSNKIITKLVLTNKMLKCENNILNQEWVKNMSKIDLNFILKISNGAQSKNRRSYGEFLFLLSFWLDHYFSFLFAVQFRHD